MISGFIGHFTSNTSLAQKLREIDERKTELSDDIKKLQKLTDKVWTKEKKVTPEYPDDISIFERYQMVFDNAPVGIFLADEDGKYIDVNPHGCNQLGYAKEKLLGKTLFDLVPDFDKKNIKINKLKEGERIIKKRKLINGKGGFTDVEIAAQMLPDGTLMGIVRL